MTRVTKPLKGHSYHNKSDAELRYIIKDAREAAECLKDVSETAEAKYLDQLNDACTVLGYRAALIYRHTYGI
jgi:hypothetical protein